LFCYRESVSVGFVGSADWKGLVLQVEGGLLAIACAKIAHLDVPAFVKDSELRFIAVNAAFELFSGLDRKALLGCSLSALTDRPEDRALEDMERRALVFAEEQIALCFDETGRDHCRVQIERFVTEDERLFAFGVFRERPRKLKARVSKKTSDEAPRALVTTLHAVPTLAEPFIDFRTLLDALPIGLLLLDKKLSIVHFNGALSQMLANSVDVLRVGIRFDQLMEAILAEDLDRLENDKACRQGFWDLVTREESPQQRIKLGDKIIEVSREPFSAGGILLLFSDVTSVQALERERLLYRSVLENVPEPVFLRDADRKLVFANAAYEQMVGGDRTRFYGLREDEMFPEGAEQMRRENIEVLETGREIEREQLVLMPNGESVPLLTSLKRIEDADGTRHIVGTLADISILKISERELVAARAEAEELYQRFERILRTMPIGVVILSQDLVINFANAVARELVNWPDDRAIHGVNFAEYIRHSFENGWPLLPQPDMETRIANRCAEIRGLKTTRQLERMLGDGRYILVNTTPLEDGQFLITYTDYTEQRLREREITEAKARLDDIGTLLQEASHVMTQGLCVFQAGKILYANEKLAEILHVPASMAKEGADWLDLYEYCGARGIFGEDPADFLTEMRASFLEDQGFSAVLLQRNGSWIKLEAMVSGENRWLVLFSDVTQEKKREAELTLLAEKAEAADRAKSRFLASMGHEIRTPMSGVLGMAELLASSGLDTRQKTFLDVIIKSGRSLQTIINDILDFARIDDRSLSLRKAPFDPMAAVEDVVLLMAGRAAEKDIELLVRGNDAVKHLVSSDAGRFRQVLTKLLDEAIKATDKGHVLIDLSEQKQSDTLLWLTLRLEDTGRGFTTEQNSLAFTKFSQFESPPVHHKSSAGLSLSIVAGLVDLFGGTIAIESEYGLGAVITVRLPMAIAGEKIVDRPSRQLQGARVLALASNRLACGILNEQVLRWGFDGVALGEAELAYTVLREAIIVGQPIELVVVDVQSGSDAMLALLRKIRLDGLFNTLAIIALIPPTLTDLERELEGLNIQAQLQKPVADASLRNAIADVLRTLRRGPHAETSRDMSVPRAPTPKADSAVVIVDANETECDFFREVLSADGIAHDVFGNEEQAYAVWQQQRPRVMLIDFAQNIIGALDFVHFLRLEEARTPQLLPTALIGLSGILSTDERIAYLTAGLDDVLVKPISPDRLMDCIRQWSADVQPTQRLA
jgi:PAS domain S-box-containing protein